MGYGPYKSCWPCTTAKFQPYTFPNSRNSLIALIVTPRTPIPHAVILVVDILRKNHCVHCSWLDLEGNPEYLCTTGDWLVATTTARSGGAPRDREWLQMRTFVRHSRKFLSAGQLEKKACQGGMPSPYLKILWRVWSLGEGRQLRCYEAAQVGVEATQVQAGRRLFV